MLPREAFRGYWTTLRPHYWVRNVFIFFGSFAALVFYSLEIDAGLLLSLFLAFVLSCLISSANYIINGILDAPFDAQHPTKRLRAIPQGIVSVRVLVAACAALLVVSLAAAWVFLSPPAALSLLGLFVAGIFYNVKPFRFKDAVFVDVVSESANNPIRFLIGWYAMGIAAFPPLLLILGFWAFGALLISARRISEHGILTPQEAEKYRPAFGAYTTKILARQYVSYGIATVALFGSISYLHQKMLLWFLPILVIFSFWLFYKSKHVVPGEMRGNLGHYRNFLPFVIIATIIFVALALWR